MSWQCQQKLLAVGWRSGEISVCNLEETKDVFEQSSAHRDAVLFLCWNVSGSRLVSGDQVGVFNSMFNYLRKQFYKVKHIVFLLTSSC